MLVLCLVVRAGRPGLHSHLLAIYNIGGGHLWGLQLLVKEEEGFLGAGPRFSLCVVKCEFDVNGKQSSKGRHSGQLPRSSDHLRSSG